MSPSDFWTVEVDMVGTNTEADALVARLKATASIPTCTRSRPRPIIVP